MPDKKNDDKSQLISLKDASRIYGFSQNYLRQLIHRDRLNGQKIGGVWTTTRNDVEKYIESREKKGTFRDDIDLNVD